MHRLLRAAVLLTAILPAQTAAAPAGAQETTDSGDESPRVDRLTFRGADAVDTGDLRESIVTRATRCITAILRPLCAITDWGVLEDEYHLDRDELRADERRLAIYYYQRGYRRAQVSSSVLPRGDAVEVVFDVSEGPPTVIEAWSLRQAEDVLSERRIRRASLPDEGDPLDLLRLSDGLTDLAEAYGVRGYLDAVLRDSIAVTPDGLRARVSIDMEPGPRSTLETLDVRGNERVSAGAIGEALRLRRGRVLRTRDIAASQRSLYESNLFHEARVAVPEQPDSAKRVLVTVREAPPRGARASGGFNTVEFVQVEGRFTHYDFLGGSRRLDLRGTLGNLLAGQLNGTSVFQDVLPSGPGVVDPDEFLRPTWQVSAEFRQPTFLSAANVLGVALFAHRRTIPGIAVDEGFGGDLSATRRLDFPTSVTASYRFEMTGVHAGDLYFCVNYGICELLSIEALRTRHALSPLALSYVDNRADDPVAPTTGYRVRADLEHASGLTMSDFRYTRVSATGAYYMPLDLHRRRVLAGRLRVGWVQPLAGTAEALGVAADGEILHPRKRFYAGGSRSVRGYHENQLGPRVLTVDPNDLLGESGGCTEPEIEDGTCDPSQAPVGAFFPRPVGGRSVVEASVEYRFPLGGSFQGAVFVDGALVGEGLRELFGSGSRAVTPGFGGRWQSPVGPIRMDLGVRPFLVEELPVVTEIVDDAGVRRLVRLDSRRRYDPLSESSGFLDQVLGRLVLHLSIGEAF
ncbi:MAG: BamA/TamA family outer membrane protein [Gemmatimonadetes bacterium]|nr:BamA/TamA family outer membrane protein [Gemmatimonadota bacterium]